MVRTNHTTRTAQAILPLSEGPDLCQFAEEFVQSVAVNVAELVFAFGILCYGVEPFLAD